MKKAKKLAALLLAFALAVAIVPDTEIDAQAAATKSHTYTLDKKSGFGYPTAVRVQTGQRYQSFSVYLKDKDDYVAKVTSNSSNLIVKVTSTHQVVSGTGYTGNSSYFGDTKFKSYAEITCYAKQAGTYTLTLTVNNAKKKQIAKKKIKVYAGDFEELSKVTYAGKTLDYSYGGNLSKKAKGKLTVKAGKGFTVKKIQVGGYNSDGAINYKTVKSGSTITLSTVKAYKEKSHSYQGTYYSYEYGYNYDYIYPVTFVKVTVYDKKLKITYDVTRTIFKQ